MHHTCRFTLLLVLALVTVSTHAVRAGEYRVPLLPKPPAIDGKIDPAEWAGAVRVDGFGWQGALERRRASGWITATATHLYFAIRSQLPEEGSLLADVKRDTENLVFDDSVEVWIDPTFGAEGGRRFQMLANSLGHRWFKLHPYGGVPDDPAWRGDWRVVNGTHDGFWHCEVEVPLAQVAPGRKAEEGAWGINLCRNWKQEWGWSSLGAEAYRPTEKVVFVREPSPAVACELRGDPFTGDVQAVLSLRPLAGAPASAQAELLLERDLMPEVRQSETLPLTPGKPAELALKVNDQATRRFTLTARVLSEGGKTTLFQRTLKWAAAGPWRWTTRKRIIPPLDFAFAYYPYLNRMRIQADTTNLPKGAVLETLTAVIRKKGGAAVKSVRLEDLKEGKQEVRLDLPPLQGEYEIALKATGRGVPAEEVVKPFERTVYEWEHNNLGKSTRVYPPFTPIRVEGKRVSTVLRDHEMTDAGLWSQVVARERPILASPMRWEAVVDGAPAPVTARPLTFTQKAEHAAAAKTGFHAGALDADVACAWEVDGMMRVDLTLKPSGGKRVDALTLVIPLREETATHTHAMGDGIRNTLYARVPEGKGVVWTAKQVRCNDLPANFCSYLYVGSPVRGLCWFAENDRGWGWDPKTPNLELVREGGQVLLRIHLVNRPEVIAAPRTLTFGLLAAPVKPRLGDDWRFRWRRERYTLLGTDINWFALGDCGSVYPAGKDLSLWDAIKRGNREKLSDEEIKKVLERGRPYFEPYGKEKIEVYNRHVWHNLRSRYGAKMVFYYNRASYQLADEFETFKDEWALPDYRAIGKGKGIGEIKIVPTESYIDHALHWYGKSFDVGGNQGVYWDNWFFVGSYNTEMTGAYARPDASVVPSTGIWGLRELAKRTFQFMNERGMVPITMPHMTSTGTLPLHSFATVQYDWEWKYSEGDVQHRFPREYLLMVSNGELAGTWPVLLGDHGKLADDPWTGRTYAAVCLVHELDGAYAGWTKTGKAQLALLKPVDEIAAKPGVDVFRYWDDRPQPVKADHPDLPTIVYSIKGKEAVFAVVSYAETDVTANLSIDAAALGFTGAYKVVDAETGEAVPAAGNRLSFPLRKHDVRVLRASMET